MAQTYETEFVNKTKRTIRVDEDGRTILKVPPKETMCVESHSPKTTYAPFSKIVFEEDGEIKLTKNRDWVFPYENMYCLECLNKDGAPTEGLYLSPSDRALPLNRGIPRFLPIDVSSPWAFCRRVVYRLVDVEVKEGDLVFSQKQGRWVREGRSREECQVIEAKRAALKLEYEKIEEAKRHFETETPEKPAE